MLAHMGGILEADNRPLRSTCLQKRRVTRLTQAARRLPMGLISTNGDELWRVHDLMGAYDTQSDSPLDLLKGKPVIHINAGLPDMSGAFDLLHS